MLVGLGFRGSELCRATCTPVQSRLEIARGFHGETLGSPSSGRWGLPLGSSQTPEDDTSEEVSRLALLLENPTRADQKLVSLIDFPAGRSIMNLPS